MNASSIILLLVTIFYLLFFQKGYWKYFLGVLIPYYVITQIIFHDFKTNSAKRKFYLSSWIHPFDGQLYSSSKFETSNLKQFLHKYNEENKTQIGITVFFMKAIAHLFKKYPFLNGNIISGKFIPRPSIDVSCMISTNDMKYTDIITIQNADTKTLNDISKEIHEIKNQFEEGKYTNTNRKMFFSSIIPSFLLAPFMRTVSYLATIGINLSIFGFPKKGYGACIVCNYGKVGLSDTFVPISSFAFSPICIGISKELTKTKINQETQMKQIKHTIRLMFTADNRYADGVVLKTIVDDVS